MSKVIDISTKGPLKDNIDIPKEDLNKLIILLESLKDQLQVDGFLLCLKETNDDIIIIKDDKLSTKDRCYILQLLQADIQEDLSLSIEEPL